jgi:hypothetical protein
VSPIAREEHPCWVPTCDFCGEGLRSMLIRRAASNGDVVIACLTFGGIALAVVVGILAFLLLVFIFAMGSAARYVDR